MQPGQNLSKNKLNTALCNTPKRLLAWGPQQMYQLIGALNPQIHLSQTRAHPLPFPSLLSSLTHCLSSLYLPLFIVPTWNLLPSSTSSFALFS